MMAAAVTLLPQPDSPTRERSAPVSSEKETPDVTAIGRSAISSVEADGEPVHFQQRRLRCHAAAAVIAASVLYVSSVEDTRR